LETSTGAISALVSRETLSITLKHVSTIFFSTYFEKSMIPAEEHNQDKEEHTSHRERTSNKLPSLENFPLFWKGGIFWISCVCSFCRNRRKTRRTAYLRILLLKRDKNKTKKVNTIKKL
jgi:hypothetical protein